MKKGILTFRNFTKFTEKHLCQPWVCNFIKKETLAQVFSCKPCEISKNIFFTEHLWTTASKNKVVKAFGKTELTNATHKLYTLLTTIFQE